MYEVNYQQDAYHELFYINVGGGRHELQMRSGKHLGNNGNIARYNDDNGNLGDDGYVPCVVQHSNV